MGNEQRQEIQEQRTEYSKLFVNEDHSFTREIYLDAIHYQDDDGKWEEMDDSLIEEQESVDENVGDSEAENTVSLTAENGETDFGNKKGNWQVKFYKHSRKQGTISVRKERCMITWALENSEKVTAVEKDNEVLYPDILPGVDDHLYIKGMTVKENLIIKTAEAGAVFDFAYHTKKLHPVEIDDSVCFINDDEEEVFIVTAPYMKDASGARSERISLSLIDEGKKDRCKIRFSADEQWLKAAERVYPVAIDPITTTSKKRDEIYDAHVDSRYAVDNFYNSIILKTRGGDTVQRSYLKFTLPEIKTGDMVIKAQLVMVSLAEDKKERTVQVHRVLQNWDHKTINWFNKPTYDETIEDVCKFTGDKQKYITMDITRLVKEWYKGGNNFGLMLRDDYELSGYTEYLSADCDKDYQNMRPRIDISYVNYSGLEDYWTYHSQEVGRAGTVYVNDYNGNVIMIHNTMATGGSCMPMALSQVYNSNDKDTDIGYGKGIRLNYHQTIEKVTIGDIDYYKHVDGDGTAHYFVKDSKSNQWKDENGLELTLTIRTEPDEAIYVIEDKDKNKMNFSKNGYLRSICDKNGNTLKIVYSNYRIEYIRDGAGRLTTLTYSKDSNGNAKTLTKVTGPDGKSKSFGYKNGCLVSVTDIDNEKMTYEYSEKNLLHQIRNIDGYEVHYAYYSRNPYRVKRIAEYGSNSKAGDSLDIVYGYNSTKFTDNKGRSEIYRFDNSGNLLHINDQFGHAASAKYCREKNYTNRLQNETKLQTSVLQLLKDPLIQAKETAWHSWIEENADAQGKINTDTANVKIGTHSLQLSCKDAGKRCCWYQDVTLKNGKTYTFSMYLKAEIEEIGAQGRCYIRVRYYNKNKEEQYIASEALKFSTPGFIRLQVSFTIPEDAASTKTRVYMYMLQVKGNLYGDMAQLEPGDTANRCNLIDNGDFYFGNTDGLKKSGLELSDKLTTVGTNVNIPVRYALMVTTEFADIYSYPQVSADKRIATVYRNQRVAAFSFLADKNGNVWYKVKTTEGKRGFIRSESVCVYLPGGSGVNSACTAVNNAVLRSAPSGSSTPVQEGIRINTCLGIRTSVKDASGNKWYEVGMDVDGTRYHGYISTDSVVRLAINTPSGKTGISVNCYSTPSTQYGIQTLQEGTAVNIRGVVNKNNGEVWYAIMLPGRLNFAYVLNTAISITEAPQVSKKTTTKVTEKINGLDSNGYIFKFTGDAENSKRLAKILDLTGKTGDTYMVNAWGLGTALPETDNDKSRRFGVEVVFEAEDGKKDVHYTNFTPDILDWQFLSDIYVAKLDYVKIYVSYTYCHNANVAFFDGLSLYREQFGQSYTYDAKGNLISVVDSQKKNHKFEYNTSDELTGITDPKGNKFTYKYDAKGNVTSGKSAQGTVYCLKYDAKGNIVRSGCVASETATNGTWVTRSFTSDKNHVETVTDTEGNKVSYTWDLTGDLLKSVTDGRGAQLTYSYDQADRLKSVSQKVTRNGVAKTVTNTYTYKNDRIQSIGHNGFSYGFEYDAFGNIYRVAIKKKEGDTEQYRGLVRYTHEEKNGNLVRTTYGNKDYVRYTYDSMDRLKLSYYYSDELQKEQKMNQYYYDHSGNLCKVICHMSGKTYNMTYDLLDRLMRVTDEAGHGYQYTYDANNNMSAIRVYSGSTMAKVTYSYDKDDRETCVHLASGKERTVSYDTYGRVNKVSWNTENPISIAYTYRTQDTRIGVLPRSMKFGSRTMSYTYDANGNITSVKDVNQSETITDSYQYDERNQLVRENSQTQKKTILYDYDLGGNLVTVKEYAYTTGDVQGAPVSLGTGTFDSIWRDKLLKWNTTEMKYDAVGNMLKKGTTVFTWNQGRMLATVDNGKKISYGYDHTGNRVRKTIDGVTTDYCMAGDLLVAETTGDKIIWYKYDSAANLISIRAYGKEFFYIKNLQNDVIALADASGEIVTEYKYDSWGKILSITGSKKDTIGKTNPFRYKSYYYDNETGMYYLRNRYYDPEIRRFINADNFFAVQGSPETLHNRNLFAYCDHNPLTRSDSDGDAWMVAAASFAVGMAASVACQMVIERKSFDEVDWLSAAMSGLGTAVGFMGIGGNVGTIVAAAISGTVTGISEYKESRDLKNAILNGVFDGVTNAALGFGDGYLQFKRGDYAKALRGIKDLNFGPIKSIPLYIQAQKYSQKNVNTLIETNAKSYVQGYFYGKMREYTVSKGRLIGGGWDAGAGKRTRKFLIYEKNGKLTYEYI